MPKIIDASNSLAEALVNGPGTPPRGTRVEGLPGDCPPDPPVSPEDVDYQRQTRAYDRSRLPPDPPSPPRQDFYGPYTETLLTATGLITFSDVVQRPPDGPEWLNPKPYKNALSPEPSDPTRPYPQPRKQIV